MVLSVLTCRQIQTLSVKELHVHTKRKNEKEIDLFKHFIVYNIHCTCKSRLDRVGKFYSKTQRTLSLQFTYESFSTSLSGLTLQQV